MLGCSMAHLPGIQDRWRKHLKHLEEEIECASTYRALFLVANSSMYWQVECGKHASSRCERARQTRIDSEIHTDVGH